MHIKRSKNMRQPSYASLVARTNKTEVVPKLKYNTTESVNGKEARHLWISELRNPKGER